MTTPQDHSAALRRYAVDKSGAATLCVDHRDAIEVARESNDLYPQHAPYTAVQLAPVQPPQPSGWRDIATDTARLRDLLEKATPGQWMAIGSAGYVQSGPGHPKQVILAVAYGHDGNHQFNAPGSRENGEYIAACNPESIRALIDELDMLRAIHRAHPAEQQEGGEALHPNHIPDLRYILAVLERISKAAPKDGELSAAVNGMRYVVSRTERAAMTGGSNG